MKIKFLKAFNGDAIWLSFLENDKPRNILIDGGTADTYKSNLKKTGELFDLISALRDSGQCIDLLILTHYDDDHLGGIYKWLNSDKVAQQLIKKVWFNSGHSIRKQFKLDIDKIPEIFIQTDPDDFETGIKKGIKFEDYLVKNGIWDKQVIRQGDEYNMLGLNFKILSPSNVTLQKLLEEYEDENNYFTSDDYDFSKTIKAFIEEESDKLKFSEDPSVANGSSIAFILEYEKRNFVFLADAHPSVIVEGLNSFGITTEHKLDAELLKVSHHGSKFNTTAALLELITTNNYLISTNGAKHGLPNKRTAARIIKNNPGATIHFNYEDLKEKIFSDEDFQSFPAFKSCFTQEFEY